MAPSVAKRLGWSRFLDPHVDDRLITEEGEYILDEIHRHWVTRLWPGSQVVLGMIRQRLGEDERAGEHFARAAKLAPDAGQARRHRRGRGDNRGGWDAGQDSHPPGANACDQRRSCGGGAVGNGAVRGV